MDDHLQQLTNRVRQEDLEAYPELVDRLRGEAAGDLIAFLRADEAVLRQAAVEAAAGRSEADLLDVLAGLVHDDQGRVRRKLAAAIAGSPEWDLESVLEQLLCDRDAEVRFEAVAAARSRAVHVPALVKRLGYDDSWRVRQFIAEALALAPARLVLPVLLGALAQDPDADVRRACAAALEKHLGELAEYPPDLDPPGIGVLAEAQRQLREAGGSFPALSDWLGERVAREVDLVQLGGFGTVLTADVEAGKLPRAHGVEGLCAAVRNVLTGAAPRAVVLLGDSGAGKTAIVHELAHHLYHDPVRPWHIVRISPTEFLAGTHYLGEWQSKVREIAQAVRGPKRAILYIPNLEELSDVGRWSGGDDNVATALAPWIERGEVAVIGECTPEGYRKGLGSIPTLRRLFHTIEVPEASLAQTRAILETVRDEADAQAAEPVLDRLVELADYYLAGTVQPGRSVGLFRRVLDNVAGRPGPVTERDVLATLSTSTGIPVDILDDGVPLDRARVRGFFEARIMGQPEAVDAVVDLVTLVKAGLTDPGKPFGVLFFIGPTGVGKTELARTLAEYLFGDASRLLRLDMSEFATQEAHERLIGWGTRPGLLTGPIRERPFSVVLLDEIEKAHFNVFDLCLQIFDAGRLTDTHGRTADFRRSILILTSNIGSSLARQAPVGFGSTAPPAADRDTTLRELGRWFRPEFINRLDRIVFFRPLDAGTAEKIARREVARVLERSGIARRKLAVDVEPAVLPLLLREGYSPAFGARPLKRTIERMVLLPAARVIAAGSVPPGSVLRLVARGSRVEVEVSPAEAEGGAPPPAARARPVTQRAADLAEQVTQLRNQAAPLVVLKSDLVTRSGAADFWNDAPAARGVLDSIYRLDGAFAELDGLDRAVREQCERIDRHRRSDRDLDRIEEQLEELETRARHVTFLLHCRDPRDLGDAFVTLTRVAAHGGGLDGVGLLGRMYQGFARRRQLTIQVLDDRSGGDPPEDTAALLVAGVGAFGLLSGEAGLHQLLHGRTRGRAGRHRAPEREVIRVEVFPFPAGEHAFASDEVRLETRALIEAQGRLLTRPRLEVLLLHVPTLISVRAWTDCSRSQVLDRLGPLLRARVDAGKATAESPGRSPVVRRYSLGPAPLVRDLRTGQTTGRIDRVLEGHLEMFLIRSLSDVQEENNVASKEAPKA